MRFVLSPIAFPSVYTSPGCCSSSGSAVVAASMGAHEVIFERIVPAIGVVLFLAMSAAPTRTIWRTRKRNDIGGGLQFFQRRRGRPPPMPPGNCSRACLPTARPPAAALARRVRCRFQSSPLCGPGRQCGLLECLCPRIPGPLHCSQLRRRVSTQGRAGPAFRELPAAASNCSLVPVRQLSACVLLQAAHCGVQHSRSCGPGAAAGETCRVWGQAPNGWMPCCCNALDTSHWRQLPSSARPTVPCCPCCPLLPLLTCCPLLPLLPLLPLPAAAADQGPPSGPAAGLPPHSAGAGRRHLPGTPASQGYQDGEGHRVGCGQLFTGAGRRPPLLPCSVAALQTLHAGRSAYRHWHFLRGCTFPGRCGVWQPTQVQSFTTSAPWQPRSRCDCSTVRSITAVAAAGGAGTDAHMPMPQLAAGSTHCQETLLAHGS